MLLAYTILQNFGKKTINKWHEILSHYLLLKFSDFKGVIAVCIFSLCTVFVTYESYIMLNSCLISLGLGFLGHFCVCVKRFHI